VAADSLAQRVNRAQRAEVGGTWQRHTAPKYLGEALSGHVARARWGTPHGFPVLYLGKPVESVVVEAYRHFIDPVVDGVPPVVPRALVTCEVSTTEILDLRKSAARLELDLPMDVLTSATNDRDAYRRCQEVAAVAHQLGLHGLVAPAATGLGETLALFTDRLPALERPRLTGTETWADLPPDPRSTRPKLRLV
jgi:RES domain